MLWTVRAFGVAGKHNRDAVRASAHEVVISPLCRVCYSTTRHVGPAAFVLPASLLLHAPESKARRSNLSRGSCNENLRR